MIQSLKEKYQATNEPPKLEILEDKDLILEDLNVLESVNEELSKSIRKSKNGALRIKILLIFMSVILFTNYTLYSSVTSQNVSFRNQTIILLPYVGIEKIDKIKSDWAQMKNSDDYKTIMNSIIELEQNHLIN